MNQLEKIFRLVISFGDSEKRIPEVSKLLQALHARLQNVLKVIQEIGKSTGIKEATSAMKIYDTTVKSAEKTKRKYAETTAEENALNKEAQKYIDGLKSKYGELVFTQKEIATLSKNYAVLQRAEKGSVEELTAKINVLAVAWKKMGTEQRNSASGKQVTSELKHMREELRQTTMAAGDNTRNIGNYVSGLYGALSSKFAAITTIAYTFKQMLHKVFQPFQDFEYRMSMVKAVTQATDEEFIALEADARRLGAATQFTATQVAELQVVYGQLGFNAEQIVTITEATLDLATATGEDLAKSADIAGATLRAYNLDVSDMPRVIDVMTLALNKSALKLDIYGEAMKYVGPIAAQTGVSIEECSALIGVLADQGIRGSMAGTSLRRILSELAKDGRPLNERLAELSKTGISVTDAMDEVGKHAMTAMTIIGNNTGKIDELTAAFENAAGAAKETAAIARDNMQTDGLVFLSAVKEKLIAIGEYLSPLAREVVQLGTTAVTNVKSIVIAIGTYIGIVKALSAAKTVGLLLSGKMIITETAYGKALRVNMVQLQSASAATKLLASAKLLLTGQTKAASAAFQMFFKTLKANPWGAIITVVAAVGAGLAAWVLKVNASKKAITDFANKVTSSEQDVAAKVEKEKSTIELLSKIIHDNSISLETRRRAIVKLNQIVPDYNAHLTDEGKLLNDNTVALKKYLVEKERELKLGAYDDIYGDLLKEQAQAQDSLDKASDRFRDAKYDKALQGSDKPIIDVQSWFKQDEYHQAQKALDVEDKKLKSINNQLSQIRYKREAILKEQLNSNATTNLNTDGDKEKGEWSLSEDKAHNDALLKLKEQLYSREIASEEAYNKKALQLEIETLTNRIALNKDGGKTLIKIKNDLADKQFQLQKTEKKEDETATADKQARTALALKYENDHNDAGIALLKDGVDKRIRLNDQATKKSRESAEQSYKSETKALEDKQKNYNKDSAEYQALEQEKARIKTLYEQKLTDIDAAGTDTRIKILRDATQEELTEYGKLPGMAAEAERQITENKRREVEERLKLAMLETEQSVDRANNQYKASEDLADATIGKKGRKRNVAHIQNELQLHKDQAQSYQKELDGIIGQGDEAIEEHKVRYDELIQLIKKEQNATINIGKGKTATGERKSIWKQFTEMSDDEVDQLKQQAFDLAAQIGNAMIDAQKQASQRRLNNEKKAIEAQYKVESKLLDSKRDKGLISEKQYQKEMEKLEAKKAQREEEAERAAFEREKKYNIAQAWMNVAMGIVRIWAETAGNPLKLPFAIAQTAFLGAQGITQTAFIASQKFAQGGIIPLGEGMGVVQGRSHAQGGHQLYIDGRPIGEIEHDELIAIVNKHDTRRIGALSAANSVHGKRFAQGGLMFPNGFLVNHVAPPVSIAQIEARTQAEQVRRQEVWKEEQKATNALLMNNIQAINNRIDTLKVVVVESDISEAQTSVKKVKVKSTW